jgi:subtilase family serine protease
MTTHSSFHTPAAHSRRALMVRALAAATIAAGAWLGFAGREADAGSPPSNAAEEVAQGQAGAGFARHPLFLKIHGYAAGRSPVYVNSTPHGYTPQQIRAYLGLSGDGAGQTIGIVDAYDHPNIAADVNTFSTTFGLPLICGTAGADAGNCFNFTKVAPQGKTRADAGWALEIALDVEWAHAVAPKADILLVETRSNGLNNLFAGIDYAAQHGASVISNSWGTSEFNGETGYDASCNLPAAVCTFASGDAGNPGLYAAYNPGVIAVGGTTLSLSATGAVVGEAGWSGSGGGVSQYESAPAYQTTYKGGAYPFARRAIPDVSYDADPGTGFAVYDSVAYNSQSGWFQLGGTSAGAPQWAAIVAVADQERAAAGKGRLSAAGLQANAALYSLAGSGSMFDVAYGSNGTCGDVCTAAAGYDAVTGIGSPRAGIDVALAARP